MKYLEYRGKKREEKLNHLRNINAVKESVFRKEKEGLSEYYITLRKAEIIEQITATRSHTKCDHIFSKEIISETSAFGRETTRYIVSHCEKCALVIKERI